MGGGIPEWEARELLAEALEACGMPWVPSAWSRRPNDLWMTFSDTMEAIAIERLVVADLRRRLPPGVSGRAVDRAWRDAAWGCTVAGLALLRIESAAAEPEAPPELLVVRAAPKTLGNRIPRPEAPARQPEPAAPVTFTIRRRGEVSRAS